jgi:hypothetical protein
MKNILFLLLVTYPCIAFSGVKISEGNLKQESCNFPEHNMFPEWRYEHPNLFSIEALAKNKLASVGKVTSLGDALFYANIVSVATTKTLHLKSQSNIEIKGEGFLTFDSQILSGEKFEEYGTFSNLENKKSYRLIRKLQGSNVVVYAVKDDGFLCSGLIIENREHPLSSNFRWSVMSNYTAFQKDPLIEQEESSSKSAEDTIAIMLVSLDDISATLAIKLFNGGKVVKQTEIQLDSMSGIFKLDKLEISFEKIDKSSIKINSITEPTDYSGWANYIKFSMLKLH